MYKSSKPTSLAFLWAIKAAFYWLKTVRICTLIASKKMSTRLLNKIEGCLQLLNLFVRNLLCLPYKAVMSDMYLWEYFISQGILALCMLTSTTAMLPFIIRELWRSTALMLLCTACHDKTSVSTDYSCRVVNGKGHTGLNSA